jgi:signal transduction histidine kinase
VSHRPDPVSLHLRADVDVIAATWEATVMERLPHLQRLERAIVIDHLPEFLVGLASWVDGDEATGRRGFEALAQGHALQRLGHGVNLATLSTEYQVLRNVILEHLLRVESSTAVRVSLVRLNDGIDYAVNEAIRRYSTRRDEIRERFVGILGHDLRNPLNALNLAAVAIASTPCSEAKHHRMGATIQRSADRMMRMISDVIDFAHAHLGNGIPAVPKHCNMGDICEEAAQELRLGHPHRTIEVTGAGDLDGHWERDREMQALSNLIGNAVQHGQDPITIAVRESPDRLTVITRVSNGGAAIPKDLIGRLFDPFRQGDECAARLRTNLGLGLYIVQQIAMAHGAVCSVTSSSDQTCFEIAWPRVPDDLMPDRE